LSTSARSFDDRQSNPDAIRLGLKTRHFGAAGATYIEMLDSVSEIAHDRTSSFVPGLAGI
jgi:hypothetical protein